MTVQIKPRMILWFPSTMSWFPIFSIGTCFSRRKSIARWTFSIAWIRMRPLVLGILRCSPESTCSSRIRFFPSYKSRYRLSILTPCGWRLSCELTHFVKVLPWTASRSSRFKIRNLKSWYFCPIWTHGDPHAVYQQIELMERNRMKNEHDVGMLKYLGDILRDRWRAIFCLNLV